MKHRLEYFAVAAAIAFVRLLPMTIALRLGAIVGALVWLVDLPHRRVARKNVAAALPAARPGCRACGRRTGR